MIRIYGKSGCLACKNAVETAENFGMDYEYIDINESSNMLEFVEKFPSAKTVPQIEWHDRHVGGYTDFLSEIENTRTVGDGPI